MDLKDIMAITGQSGLFHYISPGRNGVIVEGLEDKKRIFVPTSARVSTLSDIAVFIESGEITLKEVLKKIREKENSGPTINHKSEDAELKKYFESILPEYDKERVYTSDIKKVINWYNTLQKHNLLSIIDVEESKEEDAADVLKEIAKAPEKKHEKPMAAKGDVKTKSVAPKQTSIAKKAGASSRKAS